MDDFVDEMPEEEVLLVGSARRAGVTRAELDSPQYERPFRGFRARVAADAQPDGDGLHPADLLRRRLVRAARRYAAGMPDVQYFSHTTAAVLWGMPLPMLADANPHVSGPSRGCRLVGIQGHEVRDRLVRVVEHPKWKLRVTDPATTWAMLGGVLRHPYDLVAAGDAAVRIHRLPGQGGRVERPPLTTIAELEVAIRMGRRPGILALREALPMVRTASASRPESHVRLILMDAGLPEPVLNHDVLDERGRFVGCVDLAYPDLKICVEYEGDQHRTDPAQWQRDLEKYEQLSDLGWRVIRVTRDHVFETPGAIAARVRSVLLTR